MEWKFSDGHDAHAEVLGDQQRVIFSEGLCGSPGAWRQCRNDALHVAAEVVQGA